jgi:hypothetical protein
MKPIIITNPVSLPDEIQIIHQLLGDGLEMLSFFTFLYPFVL